MYVLNIMLGFSAVIVRTGGNLEAYLALTQAFIVLAAFTSAMIFAELKLEKSVGSLINDNNQDNSTAPGDDSGNSGDK